MLSSGDQSFDGDHGKYSCNVVLLRNSFHCVSVCGRHTLGKEKNRGYKLKVQGFLANACCSRIFYYACYMKREIKVLWS